MGCCGRAASGRALQDSDACARTQLCLVLVVPRYSSRTMETQNLSRPSHTVAQVITSEQQDAWFALLFAHATVTDRIDRELQEAHRISFSATEIQCRLYDEEPQSVGAFARHLVSVSP